jgi:acyl carrier protein
MKEKLFTSLAEALDMDVEKISMTDQFRNYESYSSLSELSVLAMLDSEFGIEIEMNEFNNFKTVEELLQLITDRSSI